MKLLSSDARNSAALAISSGSPRRPRGVAALVSLCISWSCSSDAANPCHPGVEVAPGTSTLTRIRRGARSRIQPRAKARIAALLALYTLKAGIPVVADVEPVRMTEAPSRSSGTAFRTVNNVPLTLVAKV